MTAQSGHTALNVALADGSVRGIASASLDTWRRDLLPNDGETMDSDW